jgi:hypothetical protein
MMPPMFIDPWNPEDPFSPAARAAGMNDAELSVLLLLVAPTSRGSADRRGPETCRMRTHRWGIRGLIPSAPFATSADPRRHRSIDEVARSRFALNQPLQ